MAQLLRGYYGCNLRNKSFRPAVLNLSRLNFSSLNGASPPAGPFGLAGGAFNVGVRSYGIIVARVLRGALKLRYLFLCGAITGGVTLNKRYEEWKDGLPDMKWLEDNPRQSTMETILEEFGFSWQINPRLKQLGEDKVAEWRKWFDSRLDDAIEAASTQENNPVEGVVKY